MLKIENEKIIAKIMSMKDFKDLLLTKKHEEQICKVYKMCKKEKINFHNTKPILLKMIEYDVEPDWSVRIQKSRTDFKNDSNSLESFENRYGSKGLDLYKEQIKKRSYESSKKGIIERHGSRRYEQIIKSKKTNCLKSLIDIHGDLEGRRRFELATKRRIKKQKEKGGWSNGLSLESFIQRHGEEEGYNLWDKRRKNQRKRFSKDYFIEEYGKEKGHKEWEMYKASMSELSLLANKKRTGATYSRASQELFRLILKELNLKKDNVYFATNNGEKIVKIYEGKQYKKFFSLDFCFKKKNIEFDGEYWHKDRRVLDENRDQLLVEKGYKVLRISDKDYEKNPVEVLRKCVEFLTKDE